MSGLLAALGYFVKELLFLVSYVKNNAFPQPLSSSDEKKYLQLLAEGNEHARNVLIEHNLRLVAHIVKNSKTQVRTQRISYQLGLSV